MRCNRSLIGIYLCLLVAHGLLGDRRVCVELLVAVEIHARIGERRLRLREVRLCLQKCALILARIDAVERLSRTYRLAAGDVFLHDVAGDARLDLHLVRTHDLSGIDVRQRRVLPQDIHCLDGSRTCAPLLFSAAAREH